MPACAPVSSPVSAKPPAGQRPARTWASAWGMRRQSAEHQPEGELGHRVVEDVGVLVTRTPRALQAAVSMPS